MKNIAFLLFLLCTSYTVSQAQLVRTGSFIASMPGVYPISGDVIVTYIGNQVTVDFQSNFSTIQGITLEVFLAKRNSVNVGSDLIISTAPLDSGTPMSTPITGARTFTAPAGTTLYEYDNILVQCTSANLLWGHANLCNTTVTLASATLPTDDYRGEQNIIASTTNAGNSTVNMEAMDCIQLLPGFTTPMTTLYSAITGMGLGCIVE